LTDKIFFNIFPTRYGEIKSTKAIIEKQTGKCKGYGFVDFKRPADAQHALAEMKIMRERIGNSKGVGFARVEFKETCEKIIKELNGKSFPGELFFKDRFCKSEIRYCFSLPKSDNFFAKLLRFLAFEICLAYKLNLF